MEANSVYLLGANKAMAMRCLWIFLAGTLILQRFVGSVSTPASTCDSPTKLYAQGKFSLFFLIQNILKIHYSFLLQIWGWTPNSEHYRYRTWGCMTCDGS